MTVHFITNYPAVFIPEEKTLVVADLHLGLEYQLYQSGIIIAPQRKKAEGCARVQQPGLQLRELWFLPRARMA